MGDDYDALANCSSDSLIATRQLCALEQPSRVGIIHKVRSVTLGLRRGRGVTRFRVAKKTKMPNTNRWASL